MRIRSLVMFAAVLLFPALSIGAPIVKVLLPTYKFGTVNYGQKVKHEFHVRNEGDQVLRISSASSPCPCVHAEFDKLIGPGQSGRLRVTLDTSKRDGSQRHLIHYTGNDPESPRFAVAMEGVVRGPIVVMPWDRFALKGFLGDGINQTLYLENNTKKAFRIAKVLSTNPAFQTRLSTVTAGQKYQIDVRIDPKVPLGNQAAMIVVQTDSKERPTVEIPMVALIQDAIQIRPNVIYAAGDERSSKTVKTTIALRHLRGRDFHLTDIKCDLAGANISQSPLKEGGYELDVQFPLAGLAKGSHRYEIALRTDAPDAPNLKIPISIRID